MGIIEDEQREAWEKICELGSARPADLADAIGVPHEKAARTLDTLWRRRLVIRQESGYVPVRGVIS
jgi:DNA-binding IclR family transcriptional regulator